MNNPLVRRWALLSLTRLPALALAGALLTSTQAAVSLVPEKVPPQVADRQDFPLPDQLQLSGWMGSRLRANEENRLLKLDPARLLEGYRQRPGRQKWDGEHVGKWLHAATLAWAHSGNAALREKLDYVASELIRCQLIDGYLGTYAPSQRWTEWDVWAHKYNLIGLITYMRHTGNLQPLPACRRMADLLCQTFGDGPGQRDLIPAGQHMGMAPTSVLEPMVLLYRLTGEARYLDFCRYILRAWEQPNGPKIVSTLLRVKRADKVGNGKAYEMLSCLNGALEFYRTSNDPRLLQASLNAWQDIVEKRLYLTGTASYREFFHDDFDLPNINNVGETCVTVTWLQFNAHLLRLTGEARFADEIEKTVLNQLFGAQSPDGSAWGYYVQMQGKKPYNPTLDGHCCVSSGPRGVALIPTMALSTDGEGIVVNLYDAGLAKLHLRDGTAVRVKTETLYPSASEIRLTVSPDQTKAFAVKIRVPVWCHDPGIKINGKKQNAVRGADGYVSLARSWKKGDAIQLGFALEPRTIAGARNNAHRIALGYGPLVLAADQALLPAEDLPLSQIGVPGPKLADLRFKAEPATGAFKTWEGAQVFRIDGVKRPGGSEGEGKKSIRLGLRPFADAGATGSAYQIWLPFRQAPADRNLLIDGIEIRSRKPNMGSIIDDNLETVAVTFNNKRAPDDWFGVQLEEPVAIGRIVFAHGKTFHDGGWFDASAGLPRVQIQTSREGEWKTVAELRGYPATTATNPAGLKGGEQFACDLAQPLTVYGVRVVGKPSSGDNLKQAFSSCAELHAFAGKR